MDQMNHKVYKSCISVIGSKMPWLDQIVILTEFPFIGMTIAEIQMAYMSAERASMGIMASFQRR